MQPSESATANVYILMIGLIMPYGTVRISPITTPGITDRYLADKIYGFPAGGVTLMPVTGSAETDPARYASLGSLKNNHTSLI